MGTNYYVYTGIEGINVEKRGEHIGKRFAAGAYCWNCQVSLPFNLQGQDCPQCHMRGQTETLESSAVGRELGFNKSKPHPKEGVASASGFIWAMHPVTALQISAFIDEYGRLYSNKEFMEVLSECPVQDYTSIGIEFS